MGFKEMFDKIKKVSSIIKPYMKSNVAFIITTQLVVLLSLIAPLFIRYLIDDVLTVKAWDNFSKFVIGMSIAIIGARLLSVVTNITYNTFSANIEAHARTSLFAVVIRKKLSFFHKIGDGEIVDRLMRSPEQLHPIVSLHLERIISSVATIFIVFVIIFTIQPNLAFISLIAAPIFILLYLKSRSRFFSQVQEARIESGRLSDYYTSSIQNIKHIKNINAEKLLIEQSKSRNKRMKELSLKYAITGAIVHNLAQFITQANQLLILISGSMLIREDRMTIGTLIAFYSYIGLLYEPMISIIQTLNDANDSVVGIERFLELYNENDTENHKIGSLNKLDNRIELKDIHFSYGDRPILNDVNLVIHPNEKVLLKGKSGIGKSTIASLLKRFYDNQSGQIKIGNQNIESIKLSHLRKKIVYLDQVDQFLPLSLKENFKNYNPSITNEQMIQWLQMTHLYDVFFNPDKQGLDTIIEKNGILFSGGQRRRISLALVLSSDADIVILDEPFLGVDSDTSDELWKHVKHVTEDKTLLVIDHSLNDKEFFDRILRLNEDGHLVEYS